MEDLNNLMIELRQEIKGTKLKPDIDILYK